MRPQPKTPYGRRYPGSGVFLEELFEVIPIKLRIVVSDLIDLRDDTASLLALDMNQKVDGTSYIAADRPVRQIHAGLKHTRREACQSLEIDRPFCLLGAAEDQRRKWRVGATDDRTAKEEPRALMAIPFPQSSAEDSRMGQPLATLDGGTAGGEVRFNRTGSLATSLHNSFSRLLSAPG